MKSEGESLRNAGKLVDKETGKEYQVGDFLEKDGQTYTLTAWDFPHKESSTGRVYVVRKGQTRQLFPGVFNLKIID